MTDGLHTRVARIQAELMDVPKTGHADVKNAQGAHLYSYDFVTEADMMKALKPLLAKHGVALYLGLEHIEQDGNKVTVTMGMVLACDGDQGEQTMTVRSAASGTDRGEKAVVKAITSATRYLLQKQFLIATDGLDPEQENIEHQPGEKRQPRGKRTPPPPAANGAGPVSDKLVSELTDLFEGLKERYSAPIGGSMWKHHLEQVGGDRDWREKLGDENARKLAGVLRDYLKPVESRGAGNVELPPEPLPAATGDDDDIPFE